MDFQLSEDQKMLIEMCHDFAIKEIRPVAKELDKKVDSKDAWSWDLVKKASKLGIRTASVPKEFGGSGLDLLTLQMMVEELAYGDGGFTFTFVAGLIFGRMVPDFPKEIRDKFLIPFVEDDTYLLSIAVSEACGCTEVILRYEPGGFETYAVRDGDEYIINGTKAYCSGGPVSKLIIVGLRTDRKGPLTKSFSSFMVPVDSPGLVFGKIHDHLGMRTLLTCELAFEDMRVPASFLIGGKEGLGAVQEDEGVFPALLVFKMSTVLGVLRALYDEAVNYARTRVVCGKPIIQHDTVKVMLADMRMRIAAARGLVQRIAWEIDHYPERKKENLEQAFLFKGFLGDMVPSILKHADEVHGGMGTNKEVLTEKLIRDAFTFLHGAGNTTIALLKGAPTLE